MSRSLQRLVLRALCTDSDAVLRDGLWQTRCLHCRAHLTAAEDGTPLGATTLEHIVPRSWFDRRAAAALVARVGAPDDARNLAIACARCNQQKGRGPDARGPADPDSVRIVSALLDRRDRRFIAPTIATAGTRPVDEGSDDSG